MKTRKVYLYVFDTMADWEVGYLTAEIKTGRYFKKGIAPINIVTVGIDKKPVITMGGLKVTPDISLEECVMESEEMLILPGGESWLSIIHEPVLEKAKEILESGNFVAAICGATFGLAKKGLLDSRNHTSNDLGYLKMMIPSYSGENYYEMRGAVRDNNLITASGISPLEFTVEVLKALEVCETNTLSAWLNLYKTQETRYFFELMSAVK